MPDTLKRRLRDDDKHYKLTLVSEAALNLKELKGTKRWSINQTMIQDKQVDTCLDATKPDQIIVIEGPKEDFEEEVWRKTLEDKAAERKILLTIVKTKS